MSEFLKIILSLSISGTLLFFVLLAAKPLYKNKLGKGWQYYIWLLVIFRMLMPFTPETTLVGSAFQYLNNIHTGIFQTVPSANDVQSDFFPLIILSHQLQTHRGLTQPQAPHLHLPIKIYFLKYGKTYGCCGRRLHSHYWYEKSQCTKVLYAL